MNSITKIISTIIVAITTFFCVFLVGIKRGKNKAEVDQLKEDNKNLGEVTENVQKINKSDADVAKLSNEQLIDELREFTEN